VADFGIARALDEAGGEALTASGFALGTPAYMSPEQAAGEVLDGRADLYALACVLYEMLAGEPPFSGATAQAILARHVAEAVPSLATVRPEVGPELERVIRRGLAKRPADRFPSAAALEAALASPELIRPAAPRRA
jgi:serine/threonine-protein kinase